MEGLTFKRQNSYKVSWRIEMECENLKNADFFGKSDPFIKIFGQNQDETWAAVCETETINNDLNPHFAETFLYYPDRYQKLRFEVFDEDPLKEEKIGEVEVETEEVLKQRRENNGVVEL